MRSSALALLILFGCAAPLQDGGVDMAPGAAQRLLMAMRYGHAAVGEAVRPSEVRRAYHTDQLPSGPAKTGRVGDWVLDNGVVVVVVGAVDGSARSGLILDVARGPAREDGLDAFEARVMDRPVRYETLKTGYDETLGTAYVAVTATVDRSGEGLPVISVETRYDLAPGLDTVLVSTRLVVRTGGTLVEVDPAMTPTELFADRLLVRGTAQVTVDPRGPQLASLGSVAGYSLQSPGDGDLVQEPPGLIIPWSQLPAVGGELLHTRALSSLERPDSVSAELALARSLGEPSGEVEVRLVLGAEGARAPGDFVLRRAGGSDLAARGIPPCGVEAGYRARLPVGHWDLGFRGAAHASRESVAVEVKAERVTFVDVPVDTATEPYDPPVARSRCPGPAPEAALLE